MKDKFILVLSCEMRILWIVSLLLLGVNSSIYPCIEDSKLPIKTSGYLDVAQTYIDQYQYDSSIMYYDSALFLANKKSDGKQIAHVLRLKGTALRFARQDDSAVKYYMVARKIAVKLDIDSICAMVDIGLGHLYEDHGMLDSAKYYFIHALSDYKKANDTIGIGRALYNLSMFYQTDIDYEKSLKYALECHRIFKRFNETELYCRSLLNLGNVYEYLEEYDTALACYEMGKQVNVELNNLKRASKFANNKAVIFFRQKKYEEAKEELLSAIEFNEKINDIDELSILYRNVSVVIKKLENREEALVYADKALLYARQLDNKELLSDALVNLGVHHKQMGNYDEAEEYYLEGIAMAEKYNLLWDMQIGYDNITLLYKAKKDYGKAFEYLNKYVDISDSINSREKIMAREKYKAEYELLHMQDLNQIKELEKKKIRFERNLSYGIGAIMVLLLMVVLFFFRMRARKNRIIAAQKIQKLEDEKKLMAARSVLVGQEKERERIARELHDGIGVLLSTASIHFSSVEDKADKETSEMLKKANKLLKEAGHEVRQISHNMMPGVLAKFGLLEAIEDIFDEAEEAGELNVEVNIVCGDQRLPENMEIMIYRVIQEMLNNTLKHAKASKVSFNITRFDELIQMVYSDNGIGFDEQELPHDKNLGLSGIRSRVEYLGGTIELKSEKGKGVSYFIDIPLSEKI